jgi:hypothetical protein
MSARRWDLVVAGVELACGAPEETWEWVDEQPPTAAGEP